MITGDNVYIAIETAMRCGILERQDEVMVLEGNQQNVPADAV
jgi:magnesium-transporting ATPase (P-type)